jgi:hypothetical protein
MEFRNDKPTKPGNVLCRPWNARKYYRYYNAETDTLVALWFRFWRVKVTNMNKPSPEVVGFFPPVVL